MKKNGDQSWFYHFITNLCTSALKYTFSCKFHPSKTAIAAIKYHTMGGSIDIPLTNGQVSAILTAVDFVITSVTCVCINLLAKKFIFYDREPHGKPGISKRRRTKAKRICSIITFLVSLWLAITVFLLELHLDVVSKLSPDTIQSQYINMTEPFHDDITHRISLPKNFRLDNDSINVMSRYPCKNGIAQLPLRPRSSFYSKANYFIFPNCANETVSNYSARSISHSFNRSYIGKYQGFKLKCGIFSIIPNNPGELIQSNQTKSRTLMEKSCTKKNVSYLLWPTIFNRSWDIGSTNSQVTSELTLALLCRKFSNSIWMRDSPYLDRIISIDRWIQDLAQCMNRINEHRYEREDSIDHSCIKRTSIKHFPSIDLTQEVKISNVSSIFIRRKSRNYTTGIVCFNATLKYHFTMIPELALSLYYTNEEMPYSTDRESENGLKEKSRGTPTSNITQMLQAFGNRNASEWLKRPMLFALPTKIRVIEGSCEKVNSVLGLAALGYSTTSVWDQSNYGKYAHLTQQQLFHSYLLSLTRYHYDYKSFFSKENDRGASSFHVSKDLTSIKLDIFFYLMSISNILCSVVIVFTVLYYLKWTK